MNGSTPLRNEINGYLEKVRRHLKGKPEEERQEILANIESHIYEALTRKYGENPNIDQLKAIIAEMASPESYDESADGAGENETDGKSRVIAYFLAAYFGSSGIHNFYLGHKKRATIQLLVTLLLCGIGPFISWGWSLAEAVGLGGSRTSPFRTEADAKGIQLKGELTPLQWLLGIPLAFCVVMLPSIAILLCLLFGLFGGSIEIKPVPVPAISAVQLVKGCDIAVVKENPKSAPAAAIKEDVKTVAALPQEDGAVNKVDLAKWRWNGGIAPQQLEDGAIALQAGKGLPVLRSVKEYAPPFTIKTMAQTDSTNVHIYYNRGIFIFGWERDPHQFCYRDIAGGKPAKIPGIDFEPRKTHSIEIKVGKASLEVKLDGKSIYKREADYRNLCSTVGIGPALGSNIAIESFSIEDATPTEKEDNAGMAK